ncbi:18528_t:CDS:2, partial [Acaulospora morrowiae]
MAYEYIEMRTKWKGQDALYQELDPEASNIFASVLRSNSIDYPNDNTPLIQKQGSQSTDNSASDTVTLILFVVVVVTGLAIWWCYSEDLYMLYRILYLKDSGTLGSNKEYKVPFSTVLSRRWRFRVRKVVVILSAIITLCCDDLVVMLDQKIFLKRPGVTSADNKEDEELSRQSTQPLRTTTDTKSLLSKKTKSTIAKSSPSNIKVKTRSKVKSSLNNNKSSVEVSSSKSASCAVTPAENITGGAASLAANVSSTITTMLNAKLHADASSSMSSLSQQAQELGKIREGERTSDESLKNYSMNEIQERTLEVIEAYEEIGNAFKRAAIAVDKLKTILPPGISIVIPQLPVTPEISESQQSEEFPNNSVADQPSANAASSSASNNASIQNILNYTTSENTTNDNGIWDYSNSNNSSTWMNHGDSSTWANIESPPFVNDDAEEDALPPLFFNKNARNNRDGTLDTKMNSNHIIEIIDDDYSGTGSESLYSGKRKETSQREYQNQFGVYNNRIERIKAGEPTKGRVSERAESSSNRKSKEKGHRLQNPTRHRSAPYTTTSPNNGKSESGTFDYSNTNFTAEEVVILEEFNKYYRQRKLIDVTTIQSKVASEISSMEPNVNFEQTAVSKLE